MRHAVEALRFLLELAALAAFAAWGWAAGGGGVTGAALALVAVAAAVLVWGRFVAPKSRRRLTDPARLGVEVAFFLAAGAAAAGPGPWWVGALLAASGVADAFALRRLA